MTSVIANPVSMIIKRSWRIGKVSQKWRRMNVLIFKKSANYGPVIDS